MDGDLGGDSSPLTDAWLLPEALARKLRQRDAGFEKLWGLDGSTKIKTKHTVTLLA